MTDLCWDTNQIVMLIPKASSLTPSASNELV